MTYATDLKPLGPVDTTVRKAQATLDELWAQTNVETRAYTGNMIALTVKRHLGRVQEASRAWRAATRGGRSSA